MMTTMVIAVTKSILERILRTKRTVMMIMVRILIEIVVIPVIYMDKDNPTSTAATARIGTMIITRLCRR